MKKILSILVLATWSAVALAQMPIMELTAGFHRIEAEVAADQQNRMTGLMNLSTTNPDLLGKVLIIDRVGVVLPS